MLSARTMTEEDAKHKNKQRLLSTRTIPNEVTKHKNNANKHAKQENDVK